MLSAEDKQRLEDLQLFKNKEGSVAIEVIDKISEVINKQVKGWQNDATGSNCFGS